MSWKQPIPTDLDEVFGTDYLCRDLYIQLLLHSANQDGFWTDDQTKRTFEIKRGQTVFGQRKWSESLRVSPATIWRALQKLSITYKKVNTLSQQGFTLVTIINYDEIAKMNDTRMTGELLVNTSKNIKSVKSVKKEEINKEETQTIYEAYKQKINPRAKLTPESKAKISLRLKTFSLEEVLKSIDNFSADEWNMTNNAFRGVAWFFHTDDRLDGFLSLRMRGLGREPPVIVLNKKANETSQPSL